MHQIADLEAFGCNGPHEFLDSAVRLSHTPAMGTFSPVAPKISCAREIEARIALDKVASEIRTLFAKLPPDEQQAVLQMLAAALPRIIPTPRGGALLGTVAKILALRIHWSIPEIKHEVSERGIKAAPKDLYNAIGYLARRGYVKRIGYGRYLVEGALLTTAEDLGGEPVRYED